MSLSNPLPESSSLFYMYANHDLPNNIKNIMNSNTSAVLKIQIVCAMHSIQRSSTIIVIS